MSVSSDMPRVDAGDARAFRVETERYPSRETIVVPVGEIDLNAAADLRRELAGAIEDGTTVLVVDLTRATFIDSMALGVLLSAARRIQRNAGALAVVCVDPNVRRIFEITLLDEVFQVVPTRAAALEALRRGPAA